MLARILSRRTLATVAIAIAAAVGSVAGVSLAQGNSKPTPTTPANTQTQAPAQPDGILAGVHQILSDLVAAGTINQQQANAVQSQADAGSIDPKQLVQSGVLSNAQMQAIGNRIDQLKRSYANP
jgi:hypothetical protein